MLQNFAERASLLDLALWSPTASASDYDALIQGALKAGVRAVCVPSSRVELAAAKLEDSTIKTVALVGFPLGNNDADVKRYEVEVAVDNGAREIEFVLNHAALKEGGASERLLLREMRDIVEAADERHVYLCMELPWLSKDEIVHACHLALDAGVTGISTATGFWPNLRVSATELKLLREATSAAFIIKAAPVPDEAAAKVLLESGANRIGVVFDPARKPSAA